MYACLCDSSWEVGLDAGQRQQAEYFGADCSQRKSLSGIPLLSLQRLKSIELPLSKHDAQVAEWYALGKQDALLEVGTPSNS